ncbi:MAG: tetratricopeptide repeat protein [Burkholderiales bacterium]
MSVINQMLVDLERRRASGAERKRIPDHVRALPDAPAEMRNTVPLVLAAVLVVVALLTAWWWWVNRQQTAAARPAHAPVMKAPPVATTPPDRDAVEKIARRMSFDLAHVPETMVAESQAAAPAGGLATASVIGRDAPAQKPSVAASLPVTRAAPANSAAPAAKAIATPRPEISKQVRELTPRQRADEEYARGVSALHQGRPGEARAAFEAALQTMPAHHSARQALVGVLLDARELVETARVLQEGLQLAPAQSGFAMALARLQVEQGDLDAAVQTLSRSIDHAAGNAEYAAFYAGLLQRQQKHAEAVEMFERALRVRGNSGIWLLGMGLSLEALGRVAEAQGAYRRAKAAGNLPGDLSAFADQRLR